MEENKTIPWARIAVLLDRTDRSQAWLAERMNVGTNVVTNWKRRGGAPLGRARELSDAFAISLEQLLEQDVGRDELSKAARRLSDRIREMDRLGLLTKQAEAAIQAFLDLAEAAAVAARGRPPK
ncbi:hypothetical protein [Cupriavidus sp. YAF13]|uniref:hypothetical protein n=1 Tax=Cupriavidus sp. YAF13 TaxID=3233075 RepID=UPI003F923CF2